MNRMFCFYNESLYLWFISFLLQKNAIIWYHKSLLERYDKFTNHISTNKKHFNNHVNCLKKSLNHQNLRICFERKLKLLCNILLKYCMNKIERKIKMFRFWCRKRREKKSNQFSWVANSQETTFIAWIFNFSLIKEIRKYKIK